MPDVYRLLVAAWYRKARWLWLLRPLEAVFRVLAALRRGAYRVGLLPTYRAPCPLVVVGNLSVGGTGKTPVVIALARALRARGLRVGVVSRGYGGTGDSQPLAVSALSNARACGDEPVLIARRSGCPVVVAADRPAAVRALLADFAVDLVLSDDGLQHYGLARDLEIVVIDAVRGPGNGFCLPAGPLREPVSRLQSADFVLQRGGAEPATAIDYQPECLVNLATGEERAVTPEAVGRRIYAVAGIGQPGQFFDSLVTAGFEPQCHAFADHHPFSAPDFAGLADRPIIMTEKDAVKCAAIAGADAWFLRINASLPAVVITAVASLCSPQYSTE